MVNQGMDPAYFLIPMSARLKWCLIRRAEGPCALRLIQNPRIVELTKCGPWIAKFIRLHTCGMLTIMSYSLDGISNVLG